MVNGAQAHPRQIVVIRAERPRPGVVYIDVAEKLTKKGNHILTAMIGKKQAVKRPYVVATVDVKNKVEGKQSLVNAFWRLVRHPRKGIGQLLRGICLGKQRKAPPVIDPDALPKDRVCLLSQVEFTNLSTNTRMKFEIVSPHEMNLEAGKISLKSPIGAALMDRKVGETVEAHTPSGTLLLRIENICF